MKKYMKPEMTIVKVAVEQHLLNDSINLTSTSASVNGSGDYNTLSRSGSIWDDDDDF